MLRTWVNLAGIYSDPSQSEPRIVRNLYIGNCNNIKAGWDAMKSQPERILCGFLRRLPNAAVKYIFCGPDEIPAMSPDVKIHPL
jgi:hypothetical protein